MSDRHHCISSHDWPLHGGQPGPLLARYGLPEETPVLDVSANLNPLGPPAWLAGWLMARLAEPDTLARYPDPGYAEAQAAIAAHEGVAADQVLLTNGGAEAIFLAAALQARERPGVPAAIIEPTFAEYARACAAHGLPVQRFPLAPPGFRLDVEAIVAGLGETRLLWLCRPNNPTATLVPRADVERLLVLTAARGTRVVVDEAFVDFIGDPKEALTALLADHPHLVLLRSLTKHFTLPGLRLGYLLGAPETVAAARDCQPAWSVNALAAALVAPLLADRDFARRTEGWLAAERPRLQAGLEALGLEVVPSRANFFLVRYPGSGEQGREATRALLPALLRRGVLARHTESFAGLDGGWLRLALGGAEANTRLLTVLGDALGEAGPSEGPR
ncbi:MAG: threonine-phosphate decarboxylase CobD [Pseudomonadota bacterium]